MLQSQKISAKQKIHVKLDFQLLRLFRLQDDDEGKGGSQQKKP